MHGVSAARFYAHTLEGEPPERWQELHHHLACVATIAERNAAAFASAEWGRLAGLWHDLGKYSADFQAYLRTSHDGHEAEVTGRVDHSTAGARHAKDSLGIVGHLLAFPIAGHHSGLLDALADGSCMQGRLSKQIAPFDSAPLSIRDQSAPALPSFIEDALAPGRRNPFSVAFFVRMLFSALVDADFLDTERFMEPGRAGHRAPWPADILPRMSEALDAHIASLEAPATDAVLQARRYVLESCRRASGRRPGFFALTVPTGGGKTLSSLAFALGHAIEHDLRRIIYVVPFTSIIEQNAAVFRAALLPLSDAGVPDPVIEHHSNLDPEHETRRSRLAAENWNAPLVVTTSVQFYESLFANRSSRCRKLHNMARSVIILDEVQVIPVEYLKPCLAALKELVRNYGCTVVLCTATQPAIQLREGFDIGIEVDPGNEIIPDPAGLFSSLKRVDVSVEHDPVSDDDLAERIRSEPQILCIVNTRNHARVLAESIGQEDAHFHLSTRMCPAHRSAVLTRIRSRLEDGLQCRVVSTSLMEAGVDVDFPLVFRALAGLDSIAQAAGRCNRNGHLSAGRTVVFRSEHTKTENFLSSTVDAARQTLDAHADPLALEAIETYFRLYYWDQKDRWDHKGIFGELTLSQDRDLPFLFGFRRVASAFRLIEDSGKPVIVPWGPEGQRLTKELRSSWRGPSTELLRKLQRFTIQIPEREWAATVRTACELVHDQYAVLAFHERHYSPWLGLEPPQGAGDLLMT
jgi:CRISPR-associated endonuclease/helicase Cas3